MSRHFHDSPNCHPERTLGTSHIHAPRVRFLAVYAARNDTAEKKYRSGDMSKRQSRQPHQTLPAKNGLCIFSSPTVVIGPCPGQMIVSSGKVITFSRLFFIASL